MKRSLTKNRLTLEELEPRQLLSADVVPLPAEPAPLPKSSLSEAVVSTFASQDSAALLSGTYELVFVDPRVPDSTSLLADFAAQNADGSRRFEIITLDASRDGIVQVTEALAERMQVDAVHFISHGTDGAVQLGSSWLNAKTLAANAEAVASWGHALKEDGDLLFYGCDLASSARGRALMDWIAELTQADVAASTDKTGAESLGANWTLEYRHGAIEAEIAVSDAERDSWNNLLATFTVTNTNDSGAGSLRAAMAAANSNGSAVTDVIQFNIAGAGVQTITLSSGLPTVDTPVMIDGWSQGGGGYTGPPLIELNGNSVSAHGLEVMDGADGSTIRGLIINRFDNDGIIIQDDATNITIVGNYIGTDATGMLAGFGNGDDGIDLNPGSSATIGGTTAAERNIISGNSDEGVIIETNGLVVVQGNYIGVAADGTTARGNTGDGIRFFQTSSNNRIGGTAAGAGNIIANNGGVGLRVEAWTPDNVSNTFLGNRIYNNGGQEIDLADNGVTNNDANDADTGTNNLQNYPVLSSAVSSGSAVRIAGTLDGTPSSYFRIEFFANSANVREGQRYLGYVNVATPATTADATFDVTLMAAVGAGEYVTATATRTNSAYSTFTDTSEFSVTRQVLAAGGRTISGTVYEDIDGDANVAEAGTQRSAGVTVDLWQDFSGTPMKISTAVTDANGNYSFIGLSTAVDYGVLVDSKTITPAAGFNAGYTIADVWADQTYASANAAYWNGSGYSFLASAGAFYGGAQSPSGTTSDDATSITGFEHGTLVAAGAANATGVDFGFSFNVVTNTLAGDNQDDDASSAGRTVQGSLRQFIRNANAIAGANTMRFVPAVPTNDSGGGGNWWTIDVTTALPQIADAGTTIDGTAYSSADGTTVVNTNGGAIGAGGTVGTGADGVSGTGDDVALGQVPRPELEIHDAAGTTIGIGLDVNAANTTIQNLSIWGFGTGTPPGAPIGDIVVRNVSGTVIQNNVIGTGAHDFVDPGPGARGAGPGIFVDSGDDGIIQNNLIGFNGYAGVHLAPIGNAPNNWQIIGNEIRGNGLLSNVYDGLNLNGVGGNTIVRWNLVTSNQGPGIDVPNASGTLTIDGNTISNNAAGAGSEQGGVIVRGGSAATTITHNIITGNTGSGVVVAGAGVNADITQNSIYGNAGAPGLGIDLVPASATTGNGVTANDAGDGDNGGNGLQNFPVLFNAVTGGGNTTFTGTLNSAPSTNYRIEFFATPIADSDPTGHGEGRTYLGSVNVLTDGAGNAPISTTLPVALAAGTRVTATATAIAAGRTSEFAQNVISTVASAYEGFDYGAGTIHGDAGGANFAGSWNGLSNPTVDGTVIAGSLADPTDTLLRTGSAVQMQNSPASGEAERLLSYTLGADGTTAWVSFLLRSDDPLAASDFGGLSFGGINSWGQNGLFVGTAWNGSTGTYYMDRTGSGSYQDTGVAVVEDVAALLVLRLDFAAGNDTATLYINPTPGIAGPDVGGFVKNNIDLGTWSRFVMKAGSGNRYTFDEIRVGSTYAEVTPVGNTLSGTVYHDVDGDAAVGADDSGAVFASATVHLYRDSGNAVIDGGESWVATTMTDASGNYSFGGLADGTYYVVVDSTTLEAPAYEVGFDIDDVWAEQTYAVSGAASGGVFTGSAGALYGGRNVGTSDNAAALGTAEHVVRRTLSGADAANVNLGFSFSAITNSRGDALDDDGGVTARLQQGTLRQFILNSNAISGNQASEFSIGGGGAQTITLGSVLPDITDIVVLDATTQDGFAGSPLIEINGGGVAAYGLHLVAGSSGSTIRGFVINRANDGIGLDFSSNNVIQGNYIGTNAAGAATAGFGNTDDGIDIDNGSANNTIGGTLASQRNVISGNSGDGVVINSTGADDNVVIGNYIGTDVTGTVDLGNSGSGVQIRIDAKDNTIGGTTAAERNVISGNTLHGVYIHDAGVTGNVVSGNYIGTNAAGNAAVANSGGGVRIGSGAANNTIGGSVAGAGNVISGNSSDGIYLQNAGTTGNAIRGNLIGLNAAGNAALGNADDGINIDPSANGNVIGGTDPLERNVISGNGDEGIAIVGASGTQILGNFIGTDVTGMVDLGNGGDGIALSNGTTATIVGGPAAGAGNVISGNNTEGIRITDATTSGNVVQGNLIGRNAADSGALGNSNDGVNIQNDSDNNTIGGTNPGEGNVISANENGVQITGSSTGNRILGNSIYGNTSTGIDLKGDGVNPPNGSIPATDPNIDMDTVGAMTAALSGGTLTLAGYVGNMASSPTFGNVRVEFFVSDNDPTGWGEGRVYLGSLTTDPADGDFSGSIVVGGLVSVGEQITATATDAAGNTSEFSLNVTVTAGRSISGTVYHDVNADAAVSAPEGIFEGATVHLYLDDGDGAIDAGDIWQATTTTDASGNYTFANLAASRYWVVVDSKTLTLAAAGFNNPATGTDDVWADQTYAVFGARQGLAGVTGVSGALYGGRFAATSDDGSLLNGEHVIGRDLSGGNATNVDYGFSFNAIVNARGDASDDDGIGGTDRLQQGTLRQFILNSNALAGVQTSNFSINYPAGGLQTIQPTAALPIITDAVNLDATTQEGFAGTPLIELDGSLAGAGANGLEITAGGSTVRGFVINNFSNHGVRISTAGNNLIAGNWIGLDTDGTTDHGNGGYGVEISSTSGNNNVIGGTGANDGNVISGNNANGISITGGTGHLIQGNRIGTNVAGNAAVGNSWSGVAVANGASATIGGAVANAGNLISGNAQNGIWLGNTNGSVVQGNIIGLNAAGSGALANNIGVVIEAASSNVQLGGTSAAARNVISGNTTHGVVVNGADDNVIEGNYIGTDVTGMLDRGNGGTGIQVNAGSTGNTIGGLVAGARNVVSGNNGEGIQLTGVGTSNNVVIGNYIGTDSAGTGAVGNGVVAGNGDGVEIANGATNNTIGGTAAGARNIISGNLDDGVEFKDAGTSNNIVLGNWIGLDVNGDALGNADMGVAMGNASSANTVGGTAAGAGNVISGNAARGVYILNLGTANNVVQGNIIGLDPTATLARANGGDGIHVSQDAANNTIGGAAAGAGNIIGANAGDGIRVSANSDGNVIRGNWIGTNTVGVLDLGNAGHGVMINGGGAANSSPTGTLIGGILAGEGNVIAFNTLDGIAVVGAATGTSISGNSIHSNDGLGIDLGDDGVTANDGVGDADTGPNTLQNYPVLTLAVTGGGNLLLTGSLTTFGGGDTYRIHVYASSAPDGSGFGEGERYLGNFDVVNAGGTVTFTDQVIPAVVAAGEWITVTAMQLTGPERNTSEFSMARQATAAPVNTAPVSVTATEDVSFAFSGANLISVADADNNLSQVDLSVLNGTLTAAASGAAVVAGDGTASLTITGTQADINGTLATLAYLGNLHYNGGDTLTITSTDSLGASDSDVVAITVTPVNDPPVITAPAAQSVPENTTVAFNVAVTDPDGPAAVYSITGGADAARFSVNAAGVVSFVTPPNFENPIDADGDNVYVVQVTVSDTAGGVDVRTFNVTVTDADEPPIGTDDSYTTSRDTPLAVAASGVLANDSDPDAGDSLSVQSVGVFATAAGGSVTINADGSFVYTPLAGYSGADSFTYVVQDADGDTDTATVNLSVNVPGNTAPVANDDPATYYDAVTTEPSLLSYWRLGEAAGAGTATDDAGLENGTYPAGANKPTLGVGGALAGDADTAASFDGNDHVEIPHDPAYALADGTVQLWFRTANPGQTGALFSKDSTNFDTGGHLTIWVDAGEIEVRLQSTTASHFVRSPANSVMANTWHHVAFSFGAGGMQLYFDGQLAATNAYTGGTLGNTEPIALGASTHNSGDGTVTPLVQYYTGLIDEVAIFDGALSADQIQELYLLGSANQVYDTDEDTVLAIPAGAGVLANDFDSDGDPIAVIAVDGNFAGVGVPVTIGSGAFVTLNADGSFAYDPNGASDSLPAGGSATDAFTYTIGDGNGGQATATVTLSLSGLNDAPVAVADAASAVEAGTVPGSNATGNVLTNDTDVDAGDTQTVSQVNGAPGNVGVAVLGTYGQVTVAANGAFTYVVDDANAAVQALRTAADTLTDVFTYQVRDTAGAVSTTTLTITIQGANDAPVAVNDGAAVQEDVTLAAAGDVLANDTDVDAGDTQTVSQVEGLAGNVGTAVAGTYGSVQIDANGSYTYTLNNAAPIVQALAAGQTVTDVFTYQMVDAAGAPSTTTLTISVSGSNDAPVVGTTAGALAYTENDPATAVDAGVTVADVDDATLASATVQITGGYVAAEDTLAFTPAGGITGIWDGATGTLTLTGPATLADWQTVVRSVTYQNSSDNPSAAPRTVTLVANDGTASSAPATRTINVTPVNDAPSVTANNLTVNDGATVTVTLANLAAADPDNALPSLIYTVSGVANGHFALTSAPTTPVTTFTQADVAAGLVVFVHDGNNLAPTYTIRADDGALLSAPSTVTVTFTPTSGGPGTTPSTGSGGTGGTATPPSEPPTSGGPSDDGGDDTSALDTPAPVSRGGGGEEAIVEAPVVAEPAPPPVRVAAAKLEKPVVEPEVMTVQSSEPAIAQTSQSFSAGFAEVRRQAEITVELGKISLPEPDGDRLIKLDLDSIRMTSLALSVGAIWWATRATGLLASLLSSLPAWRNFDPLPVLGRDEFDEDDWREETEEEAEEESLVQRTFSGGESQPIDQEELKRHLKR